jgi:uncharacterized protein (TIGR02145 family)
MIKSVVFIIKLVSISFLVMLSVMCDKPENKLENNHSNNPCNTSIMQWNVFCLASTPINGAIVSPRKLVIKWIGHDNSIFSLYFGTNKDNLPCISQQSTTSFLLKNLDLNTTYYWNVTGVTPCHSGCSTGISSFTTVADTNLPFVITAPVYTHMKTPPRAGGNIMFEGSSKVIECGIYFGLSPNPEIAGTEYQIGKNSGLFSDLIPGLNSGSTYYVKAYATNGSGTVFGSEVSFTTGQVSEYQFINDIEGNKYYVINLGDQQWMAENLRSTKFSDGSLIPNVTDDYTWETMNTPAYCWYDNNSLIKSTYGALYNWYTTDTASNGYKNICPSGWHVPDDKDWATLTTYLGGEAVAGIKLKETGDYYWSSFTSDMGDNSSDFSALAGGMRFDRPTGKLDGSSTPFFYTGATAMWWGNNSVSGLNGLAVGYNQSNVFKFPLQKNEGHSIRCVKDSI